MRLTSVRELASGVDALYLSGRGCLFPKLVAELAEQRELAEHPGHAVTCEIAGEYFEVLSHGMGRYRFCLRHRHCLLGVSPSERLPPIRLQLRSEFLHGAGVRNAVGWSERVAVGLLGVPYLTVSRIDLYVDVQGWELSGDDRRAFVCRARERDTYERDGMLTGFTFGRRSSGTISARIYNKTVESERKGTDFWRDVWGEAYDASRPVLRVEFELHRGALRQFELQTVNEVLDATGAVWAWLSSKWLTFRTPTNDSTRARWPIASEWTVVQHALISHGGFGIERMYERRRQGSLRIVLRLLRSYVAHYAALRGTEDIDEACRMLQADLRRQEATAPYPFASKVAEYHTREQSGGGAA